ncbi:hypothetical protein SCP_0509030 [Sparassis crispa]|uniref:Sacsin/Nov domain-containing protein n=1 Tax=Sparassis crispa TaxID=139825 RepID=A0A401GNQ5_9APHY|nr:hypothetical protein SCP_0509030 [Sparassis crispa]GBE83846.1 hypothetical protein SCP_0509030 [Sparassis crispa]
MMPENFREHVDVASSIKGILDSYPGNSILRELLQNSDDAGASTQIYVLDTRTHSKDSVIDPVLKDTQGPALLAWNDSVFKDSDWAALSTIRGSNKTADETKTGKYGLGFRAVTDNPHVLSGNKLVIFDPHEEFSGSIKGGVQINIQQDGSKYCDQLAAFDSAVPMLDACVDSTIVRLPLRTDLQADKSRIKSTSMHIEDMKQFFEQFIVNELGVALLFLQHVTSIQLREVTPEGQDVFLAEVKITDPTISARRSSSRRAASASAFICPITTRVHDVVTACVWRICHSCSSPIETSKIMSARLSYDVGEQLKEDKLFAHVAFAIPLKEEKLDGRLFTLLPLPIVTNFPAHMHAIFALTPDRQCLRNEKEMGIGVKARERFLAVWNRILFEEFAPTTWANMLNTLIYEDGIEDAWSAWPPSLSAEQAGDVYWGNMLVKMLIQVIHRDLPVFPTMSERTYVSSSSVVFAEPDQDVALLSALTRAGIYIVQPPLHIYQLLNDTGLALQCAILSRKVVHAKLLCRTSELAACSDKDKNIILDYFLVPSPPDLDSVVHLPIIPLVRGSWTALSKATLGRHKLIMVTDEEATLFGECEPEMIALSSMSPEARHALYCSSALQYLNVADLGAETVHKFLFSMFGRLDPEAEAVPISDSPVAWDWYIRFWAWLNGRRDLSSSGKTNQGSASQKATPRAYNGKTKGKKRLETPRKDLIPTIGRLHLLPTSAGLLRTVQSGISLPGDVGIETMSILTSIGICFLDPLVAQSSGVSILSDANIAVSSHDISFMLNNIDASLVLRLDRGSSKLLQGFLVECLQIHPTKLNKTERAKMMLLPVFPIRVCPSSPSEIMAISTLGPATGDLIFLQPDVADDCPLPKFQRTTTFIELAPETHLLASSLEENAAARACNELKVLELAIPHLGTQPLKLLDGLISRIIPRLLDLSQSAIDCLKRTKFIPVRGGIGRFTPTDIIDPQSDIATLFSEHDAKFPSGMFESGRFLSMMQAQDFFKSKLDPGMVSECIKSISSLNSTQLAATRAKSLLRLLDQAWCSSFASCLVSHDKWLPTDGGSLCCRTRCRDRDSDVYLFDMVLSVMEVNIAHPDIRSALGWSNALPFDVIHSQLSSTLGAETIACRGERLAGLISYMADQWKKGVMTNEDIAVLKDIVLDCPWIPLSSDHLLLTRQALLARDARIGASFRSLPRNLATGTCGEFLRHMGCVDRPSLESLLVELAPSETKQTIHNIIELLEEISCHTKHGAQVDTTNCILVPDHLGHLRPYHDVYYDDLKCGQSFVPEHGFPTHPSVSRLLAVDLCLRFLSGLQLGEDEDEDEDDVEMREELRTRISSVLHDYDIKYSFNEIMANASDAGASSVSVLLDERSFDSNSILTLDMARFQRAPSIVLHNDGTFSQEDFDGFRSIGIGGKSENPDSIGRFGLGALAMYHFSEVVMVVSGQYLMILDPSARYLPLRKGRRRTCVFRPLSQIAK